MCFIKINFMLILLMCYGCMECLSFCSTAGEEEIIRWDEQAQQIFVNFFFDLFKWFQIQCGLVWCFLYIFFSSSNKNYFNDDDDDDFVKKGIKTNNGNEVKNNNVTTKLCLLSSSSSSSENCSTTALKNDGVLELHGNKVKL